MARRGGCAPSIEQARAERLLASRDAAFGTKLLAGVRAELPDQVLIELDPRPLEAQWRQTQGNLARDQAQLAKARADQAPAERTGEARARPPRPK